MNQDIKLGLLSLLKILDNVESFEWKKGQKPVNPARMLANLLMEHSDKATAAKVRTDFGALCESSASPQKVPDRKKSLRACNRPVVPAKPKADTDASVVTICAGPYGTPYAADADALQFKHPNVMHYRPVLFPNPDNFGVVANIVNVARVEKKNRMGVTVYWLQLTIEVTGPKAEAWCGACTQKAASISGQA